MPLTLIEQKPNFTQKIDGADKLAISEMFANTIQGEGITTGVPSTFIRLQGCTLKCVWCDTLEVWTEGNEYSYDEIFQMFEENNLISAYKNGQHLIFTGGSPLKQQDSITRFILSFRNKYGFKPYIEIENEAVLPPSRTLLDIVDQWNNSPKLANSGMKEKARLKPEIISLLSHEANSWFKFVVSSMEDWDEIKRDYLPHIKRNQIILMPEGQTQDELSKTRELTVDLAIRENVRYCDREHIVIWDRKTGT